MPSSVHAMEPEPETKVLPRGNADGGALDIWILDNKPGGGTTMTVASGALWGVLLTEAKLARRWVGSPSSEPPDDDGIYGF